MRNHPLLYEINTATELEALSRRYGRPITLGDIPADYLDALKALGFDAVWMMGVWERSPQAREIGLHHPDLQMAYRNALGEFTAEDIVGSPYAVRNYHVDARFGGREGLAHLRAALKARGLRLFLDYVPNHVAVDHPWTWEAPEALVRGNEGDLVAAGYFFEAHGPDGARRVFAHGRDPYFPAWTDTAQIDAFSPTARARALETLRDIATQCDGVRCDMAMLRVCRVLAGTPGRAGLPSQEFWVELISAVKAEFPGFQFMAEVYWGMEWELIQQGFDFCYDKTLYDRLRGHGTAAIRDHLTAPLGYQQHMARFVENHDEERVAHAFSARAQAAAVINCTLPGLKLLYNGQFEGRRLRVPVQLGRAPNETPDTTTQAFYAKLLTEVRSAPYHEGTFVMLACLPLPGNDDDDRALAYAWASEGDWRVVVATLDDQPASVRVMLPIPALAEGNWRFEPALTDGAPFTIAAETLLTSGLPVTLERFSAQIFRLRRA